MASQTLASFPTHYQQGKREFSCDLRPAPLRINKVAAPLPAKVSMMVDSKIERHGGEQVRIEKLRDQGKGEDGRQSRLQFAVGGKEESERKIKIMIKLNRGKVQRREEDKEMMEGDDAVKPGDLDETDSDSDNDYVSENGGSLSHSNVVAKAITSHVEDTEVEEVDDHDSDETISDNESERDMVLETSNYHEEGYDYVDAPLDEDGDVVMDDMFTVTAEEVEEETTPTHPITSTTNSPADTIGSLAPAPLSCPSSPRLHGSDTAWQGRGFGSSTTFAGKRLPSFIDEEESEVYNGLAILITTANMTWGESRLYREKGLMQWRVKQPSLLRVCWTWVLKGEEGEGLDAVEEESEESEEDEDSEGGVVVGVVV